MITYKDYIKLMEGRGYSYRGLSIIDEDSPIIKTFPIDKGEVGKILELQCPDNTIISACGENHPGGCERDYSCSIKCFDDNGKEPFQDIHQFTILTSSHSTIVDIIVTKILHEEVDRNDPNIQQSLIISGPILNFIRSNDPCEYPMWNGNYKTFHHEFLNDSFNLYSNEKMVFYITKPDVDISRVKFEIKVDILEIKKHDELTILDKDKITDIASPDYKSVINV